MGIRRVSLVHLGRHVPLGAGLGPKPRRQCLVSDGVTWLVTQLLDSGCSLAGAQLLTGLTRPAAIPAVPIHGRHDVSDPLDTPGRCIKHGRAAASSLDARNGGGNFPDELRTALDGSRELHRPGSR